MKKWWFRKPWWSDETNGRMLVGIIAFVNAFAAVMFASEFQFRMIVALLAAMWFAPEIMQMFRKEPPDGHS